MDVSSRELREGNIRDALRGYNHDDVDELLERAAATIDGLSERVGELNDRVSQIETEATRGRETEDMLQRTLLLAQRAADEALDEARANAQRILEDAEKQANEVVSDAERNAQREMEEESRRLQGEVREMAAKRDALDRDVNALVEFAEQLGDRLRDAFETQLAALAAHSLDVGSRPVLSEVELPPPIEGYRRSDRVEDPLEAGVVDAGQETIELAEVEEIVDDVIHQPSPVEPVPAEVEADSLPAAAAEHPSSAPEADPGRHAEHGELAPDRRSPLLDERFGLGAARPLESRGRLFDSGEVLEGEVLDDETFFASLRDAVRDERPLGPRDEEDALGGPETHGDLFNQEDEGDEDDGRGFFRRRR